MTTHKDSDMDRIERCCRAFAGKDQGWFAYKEEVSAMLDALTPADLAELAEEMGLAVVPKEPSEECLDPIAEAVRKQIGLEFGADHRGTLGYYKRIFMAGYRTMLAGRIKPGPGPGEGDGT